MFQLKTINSRARTKSRVGFLLYSIVLFLNNKLETRKVDKTFSLIKQFFPAIQILTKTGQSIFSGEKNTLVHVISQTTTYPSARLTVQFS